MHVKGHFIFIKILHITFVNFPYTLWQIENCSRCQKHINIKILLCARGYSNMENTTIVRGKKTFYIFFTHKTHMRT